VQDRLRIFLAFLFIAALAPLALCQTPALAGLPGPLTWQNAPAEWKIGSDQSLSITAGPHTDWFVSPMDAVLTDKSPRLVFKPADDFVLSARATVDFRSQWDAGVLVLYVNGSTWAKLCFEMSIDKTPTIVSVVTKTTSDDNNSIAIQGKTVYLKIAKAGQAIFFYASEDGQKWKIIRAFSFGPGQDVRVGFSSQAPGGDRCTTVFDHIAYQAKRVNLWTGE